MPKNIVLLSDGTGNSAAKRFKTNVWRIYDALDLRNPAKQVACYDDGVGTSSFRPLALLGGAVGFGLKRNVLRLYRFLCEQYEPGDQIYAFGFSRGAFTIRVLVALIADQGIVRVRADKYRLVDPALAGGSVPIPPAPPPSSVVRTAAAVQVVGPATRSTMTEGELRRLASRAYEHFRDHKFERNLPLVRLATWLRRRFRSERDRQQPYDPGRNYRIPDRGIAFVGLWDTVDAYGLPIDELTEGVNKWIWPLSFPELELSPKVKRACHAISIDDERHTFHPVLWDEANEERKADPQDERIQQVWFAGVHANVGGGYPNDALSAVSLDWMIVEARKARGLDVNGNEVATGLVFLDQIEHATDKRDPLGLMYDSRRGLAVSYRYNPRKIQYLTNGQVHEKGFRRRTWPEPKPTVTIRRPKIHESVITRIKAAADFYAPIGLPGEYDVVRATGEILPGPIYHAKYGFETADNSRQRVTAQEVVWDLVWYRRITYVAGVIVSLLILSRPMWGAADPATPIADAGVASRIIRFLGRFLPDIAAPWLNYYAARPVELAVGLAVLGLIVMIGHRLKNRIGEQMHAIWRWVLATLRPDDLTLPEPRSRLYRLRQHPYYHASFAVFRRHILPHAFGLSMLLVLLVSIALVVVAAVGLGVRLVI